MNQAREKVAALKGMNDILPDEMLHWRRIEQAFANLSNAYGYRQIRTPIVEHTRLFTRGIGEVTDIVEREMYSFVDALNDEHLTLRPENTAAVVRAVIEHNLLYDGPKRLWYVGPMFRHERPQRGRQRQFHQFGVEALGFAGPDIDAEVILMGRRLWDDLGLSGIRLEINSIGEGEERARYRAALIEFLSAHEDVLDDEGRRRLHLNPMRILDSKHAPTQKLVADAPSITDFLGEASRAHLDGLIRLLKDAGVEFTVNPRLVRGLDYYNRTVFEWISDSVGAQATICGGGRYDTLIELFGGKHAPACGFAMGVERLLDLVSQQAPSVESEPCDVYVMHQGEDAARSAMQIAEGLRASGFLVVLYCSPDGKGGSFKSQMRRADASGAEFAVILGEDEMKDGSVTVKALREGATGGTQQRVPADDLIRFLVDATCGDDDIE